MQIIRQRIDGVFVIEPSAIVDARGFFSEIWHRRVLSEYGIDVDFVQENMSLSKCANTVRGLHFQSAPHAQAKLVRVSKGRIFDVAVDVRPGSATYKEWVGVELSAENKRQLFIPKGFLHGFVTREPDTEVIYKCSDYYSPECEGGVQFSDPDIGIDWGIQAREAILSPKDAKAPRLRELVAFAAQGTAV
jgi:dTDP-4-dehydrorhamnose 3,5-epimerase